VNDDSEIEGLCPPITDQRLDAVQRMAVARVLVDCFVEAHVTPQIALTALDRLYSILHGTPARHGSVRPQRWARPRLQVV
jgi:hypothetical protein